MIAVFALASLTAAGLLGFATGAAAGWLPDPSPTTAAGVLGASVVADLIHLGAQHRGRRWLQPLRIEGQVPREWSEIFAPGTVALLYGARLGVGPATLLPTWSWWAATLIAAPLGPGPATAAGATFGFVRAWSIIGVSLLAERRSDPGAWFRTVGSQWVTAQRVALGIGGALTLGLLSACSSSTPAAIVDRGGAEDRAAEFSPAGPAITAAQEDDDFMAENPTPPPPSVDDGNETTGSTGTTSTTDPARSSGVTSSTAVSAPVTAPVADHPLARLLVNQIPDFIPIDEAGADTHLDLEDAANRQPDPHDELPLLITRGYADGWTRAFRNASNDVLVATVYRFASPDQADFYLQDGLIKVGGYGGQIYDVAGVPGLHAFRQAASTDRAGDDVAQGVTFTEGDLWFLLFVLGDAEVADSGIAVEAAQAQWALARLAAPQGPTSAD